MDFSFEATFGGPRRLTETNSESSFTVRYILYFSKLYPLLSGFHPLVLLMLVLARSRIPFSPGSDLVSLILLLHYLSSWALLPKRHLHSFVPLLAPVAYLRNYDRITSAVVPPNNLYYWEGV